MAEERRALSGQADDRRRGCSAALAVVLIVVLVLAVDLSSSPAYAQQLILTPELILTPDAGKPGQKFEATYMVRGCENLKGGRDTYAVQLLWDPQSSKQPLGSEGLDRSCSAKFTPTVPSAQPGGAHEVQGFLSPIASLVPGPVPGSQVSATFTVRGSATTTAPSTTSRTTPTYTTRTTQPAPTLLPSPPPGAPALPVDRDSDSGLPLGILLLAVLLLLAGLCVLGFALVRRRTHSVLPASVADRPTVPVARRRATATPRGRSGLGLRELADLHVQTQPAPDLSGSGPDARRLRELCPHPDMADPLLATMVWRAFSDSTSFDEVVRSFGASRRADSEARLIVIEHSSGHTLLVLDDNFQGPGPSAGQVEIPPGVFAAEQPWLERLVERSNARPWSGLDHDVARRAIEQAASAGRFSMMVARAPSTVPLVGPAPARAVQLEQDGAAVATVGVMVEAASGKMVATTALHAVEGRDTAWVDGHRGRIVATDRATDSCLIEVEGLAAEGGVRALQDVTPRQNEAATFDGVSSGRKSTRVVGWDMSILAEQQWVGSKVYTSPDTIPGDSGAALVDSTGNLLGFAAFVTAMGEAIQYSAWVWADQVLDAHGLEQST